MKNGNTVIMCKDGHAPSFALMQKDAAEDWARHLVACDDQMIVMIHSESIPFWRKD